MPWCTPLRLLLALGICLSSCSAEHNRTKLQKYYGGVKNWYKFSRRYDISRECSRNESLRVAYFTRHAGTMWDFISVADHLNVTWTNVHPGLIFAMTPQWGHPYANDQEIAGTKWNGVGQMYCHIADILQFGDITADARPLLQGNCSAPIILQVTARFDHAVKDFATYHTLMKEVAMRPNVWWIVNNPYDKWYIEWQGVKVPEGRMWLLRPVGESFLPLPALETYAARADKIAYILHDNPTNLENTFIFGWIKAEKLSQYVAEHPMHFGGPAVLAQHRGVIQVPYQVSVMKMYEGMAYGAAFILPSARFFAALLQQFANDRMAFCCRDLITKHRPDDWHQFMEWYHPDFAPGMVYYESWDELKAIIEGEGIYTKMFFEDKKTTAKAIMERMRRTTFEGFDQVYDAARRYACATNGQPDVWSEGLGTDVDGQP